MGIYMLTNKILFVAKIILINIIKEIIMMF